MPIERGFAPITIVCDFCEAAAGPLNMSEVDALRMARLFGWYVCDGKSMDPAHYECQHCLLTRRDSDGVAGPS